MRYKKGMTFISNTGRLLTLINKATGNNHWNAKIRSGNTKTKTHKIHEGTLRKYYKKVKRKST